MISFADELKLAGMQQYDEEEYRYESDMNQKIQEQQQHLMERERGERPPRGESSVVSPETAEAQNFLKEQFRAQQQVEEQDAFLRAQNTQQQQQHPELNNPSSSFAVAPAPASMSVPNPATPSVTASVLTAAGSASAFTSVTAHPTVSIVYLVLCAIQC